MAETSIGRAIFQEAVHDVPSVLRKAEYPSTLLISKFSVAFQVYRHSRKIRILSSVVWRHCIVYVYTLRFPITMGSPGWQRFSGP